jgi:hypothetical protein
VFSNYWFVFWLKSVHPKRVGYRFMVKFNYSKVKIEKKLFFNLILRIYLKYKFIISILKEIK